MSIRFKRKNGVSRRNFSTLKWKRRPTRSSLMSLRLSPKRSTSKKTSRQRVTKYFSCLRISSTNIFAKCRSVELIGLPASYPEYSILNNSILFFGLICSIDWLKIREYTKKIQGYILKNTRHHRQFSSFLLQTLFQLFLFDFYCHANQIHDSNCFVKVNYIPVVIYL